MSRLVRLQLLRGKVSHILEQPDRRQVVVDVVDGVVGPVHVDRVQEGDEVLLAQHGDVVGNDEFEAPEATLDYLFAFVFDLNAYGDSDYSPAFVFDLLTAGLDDFFNALQNQDFILD